MRGGRTTLAAVMFAALLLCAADPAKAGPALQAPASVGLGEPFVAVLTSDEDFSGATFTWLGASVPAQAKRTARGWQAEVLLGTDVGKDKSGTKELGVAARNNGKPFAATAKVEVAARDHPKQELSLPEGMVSPSEKNLERIARERKDTDAALATMTPRGLWTLPLARPVPGETGSVYGLRRILNGKPKSPHRGVDFRASEGQNVRSVADGMVVLKADQFYAGQCVYVDHGQGVVSAYFHLSRVNVAPGQHVRRGESIGLAGASGRATGPHLHFALCLQGRCVDPLPLMDGEAKADNIGGQ